MNLFLRMFLGASFLICMSVWAESMHCVGMDGSKQTLRVIVDVPTGTVNINSNILDIASGSKDGSKLTTRSYVSDKGVLTKVVLVHTPGQTDVTLFKVNSVTNKLIARAPLACHKEYD